MIHENVERIRKARGVTKTHIAKRLHLSLQGYRHITTGKVRMDVERLRIIAEVLGVEPAVFFSNELTESVIKYISDQNPHDLPQFRYTSRYIEEMLARSIIS